jgi:putative ABC transport system permease protein
MMRLPIMLRLGLRYISRRLFQSVMFILGVALGVAVVIAIDIANGSASRAFSLSTESVTGRATHQIVGGPAGLSTDLYTQVRLNLGIRLSAPVVSEFVRVTSHDQPLRLLGIDPFAEPPFRQYLMGGNATDASATFGALNRLIAEPSTIVISDSLAERLDVGLNDSVELSAGSHITEAHIVGIIQPDNNASRQALDDIVITDIASAQEIVGLEGRINRIDLILKKDFDTTLIANMLPKGVSLVDVNQGSALDQMIAAFEINLQALSLLALVVGLFLIYNTVTFSVVQRRKVIGILRSIGATKAQIFAFILGEAFILGLIGTVLGMGLGIIFGRGAVVLVSQTISDLYFTVNVQSISIDPFSLIKAVGIGLFASVAAAILPSYDATRTAPAGVMQRSSEEEQTRKLVPYITLLAVGVNIAGLILLQLPTNSLYVSFAALFFIIVGSALFTPIMLLIGMRLFLPVTGRLFGVLGRMAPRAVTRSLSRTSVAVAALTIAVSVIVGVSAMISSFRMTVSDWLGNTLGAEVFISPPLLVANNNSIDVDPAILDIVEQIDGIQSYSSARAVSAPAPDYPDMLPVNILASKFDIAGANRRFKWTTVSAEDHQDALDAGKVMVSEPFSFRRNITEENNTITLQTDQGAQTFEIFGVYYDYSTDQGTVYMARAIYDQYFDDPYLTSLGLILEPDADTHAVIDDLQAKLADYDLIVQDNESLRSGALDVFDRTFSITIALRLLATLVAFIGILSALMSLQLEHTREYGMMRANGMTGGQLTVFTLIQTGLMGLVAGILALPIGMALSLVLIYVVNVRSFGWTMQFTLLPNEFAEAFLVAIVAALLAGIYPAFKLSRLKPATALRSE